MNETLKRSISGAVYVALLITAILFSTESFFALFGIFLLIAVYEFCDLVQINKILPIILASGFFIAAYHFNFSRTNDQLLLAATLIVSVKCIIFLFQTKTTRLDVISKFTYLIGYIILPFIIITKIPFGIKGYNPKIIISIFILIWTNDTFAYLVGKSIGKHKLFERVSPKKTIEGFLGGIFFAVMASFIISKYYIAGAQTIWIFIALIVGFFGTIGDLIESKFKRIAGVKDSGKIMPGHGGVLDRLDSIIFVAPIIYLLYQILYYVS
jgi:phosphatidate cytidylyltransferase